VLHGLQHATVPFPYFHCASAFSDMDCAGLRRLFSGNHVWQSRDEAFYQCFLRDATTEVDPILRAGVLKQMRAVTGLPLTDQVHITAQRMEPGQAVGVHSDQPLLGYEIARLVVQLNADWIPEHGGALQLMATQDGPAVRTIDPHINQGFGFVLHPASFHAVTRVTAPRWSVVFNFWHPANSPALADAVHHWVSGLDFGALPGGLSAVAEDAESRLPEEVTYGASVAAWLLQKWGFSSETVIAGYVSFLGESVPESLGDESRVAILLAVWVAALREGHFSLARWDLLRRAISMRVRSDRLSDVLATCGVTEDDELAFFHRR